MTMHRPATSDIQTFSCWRRMFLPVRRSLLALAPMRTRQFETGRRQTLPHLGLACLPRTAPRATPPLSVTLRRFRYRAGLLARRSTEDLPPSRRFQATGFLRHARCSRMGRCTTPDFGDPILLYVVCPYDEHSTYQPCRPHQSYCHTVNRQACPA